jgi:hypothetical protein
MEKRIEPVGSKIQSLGRHGCGNTPVGSEDFHRRMGRWGSADHKNMIVHPFKEAMCRSKNLRSYVQDDKGYLRESRGEVR